MYKWFGALFVNHYYYYYSPSGDAVAVPGTPGQWSRVLWISNNCGQQTLSLPSSHRRGRFQEASPAPSYVTLLITLCKCNFLVFSIAIGYQKWQDFIIETIVYILEKYSH